MLYSTVHHGCNGWVFGGTYVVGKNYYTYNIYSMLKNEKYFLLNL